MTDTVQKTTEYDTWFRAKVEEALNDKRLDVPHREVEAHFAKRRVAALRKANTDESKPCK